MSYIELPIGKTPLTGYMEEALPLSVALSSPRKLEWLYSNYIQLIYQNPVRHDNQPLKFYKLSTNTGYVWDAECPILNYDRIPRSFLEMYGADITDFICFAIKNDQYPVVYMDEYYLSYRKQYHKKHYIHESLFYGFDSERKMFKGLAYVTDSEGYKFKTFETNFDEVRDAYNNYFFKGELKDKITLLSIEKEKFYSFNLEAVEIGLREYIASYPSEKRYAEISTTNLSSEYKYGIGIYEPLIDYLKQEKMKKSIIPFQILVEHKSLMCERYYFMVANRYIKPDVEVEEGLLDIKKMAYTLKLKFIKYKISKKQKILDSVINYIGQIREKEIGIFSQLLKIVERGNKNELIFSKDGLWFEINKSITRVDNVNNEIRIKLYLFEEKTMGYIVFSTYDMMVDYMNAVILVMEVPNKKFFIEGNDGKILISGLQCVPGEYEIIMSFDFKNGRVSCNVKSENGESGKAETEIKNNHNFEYIDRVAIVHEYAYRYAIGEINIGKTE